MWSLPYDNKNWLSFNHQSWVQRCGSIWWCVVVEVLICSHMMLAFNTSDFGMGEGMVLLFVVSKWEFEFAYLYYISSFLVSFFLHLSSWVLSPLNAFSSFAKPNPLPLHLIFQKSNIIFFVHIYFHPRCTPFLSSKDVIFVGDIIFFLLCDSNKRSRRENWFKEYFCCKIDTNLIVCDYI